jgi:mono/diheme cytochrome c family protein
MRLDPTVRGGWAAAVLAGTLVLTQAASSADQQAPSPSAAGASQRGLVDQYCAGCHNDKLQTAGVSLQPVNFGRPGDHVEILERVLRKVRSGEMPPAGRPRPDAETMAAFRSWLEGALDKEAAAHPNPGRTGIHRLNRAEYSNAVRDLLAVNSQAGAWLPVDDSGYGFDNIADVLSTSPALLERYMIAARRVSRLAVGDLTVKPSVERFEVPRDAGPFRRTERVSDDLPFGSRGGLSVQHYFPLDADYVIRIGPAANAQADGGPEPVELRVPIKAGLHTVGVTFRKDSTKAESEAPGSSQGAGAGASAGAPQPALGQTIPQEMDLRFDGARLKLFELTGRGPLADVGYVTIAGPYDPTGRGDTASRRRIFVCRPAAAKDETPCARTILTTLVHRAFRRPAAPSDVQPLLVFYESGRRESDFDSGIEEALTALLVSPEFLFRMEQDPRGSAPRSVHRLSDLELASRLSFFLWSTIPDDQLLELAGHRKLMDPPVLQEQVQRMLDDPRSSAFVGNFGGQWLYTRNIATVRPDPGLFRFDASLREALQKETALFFDSILRDDRSIMDFLGADYTFVNERLAQHYGIRNVYGPQFRRVAVTDPNRRGLLGQGSILTVTSYPNRTSVVQRGKWVLENLLGMPPPPPPANVPSLTPRGKDGKALSVRQQMEIHRANPVCASCHARMDPLGFALENYDGVGRWRNEDAGSPIDASGALPDGTRFEGPSGLTNLLLTRYREQFARTFADKLLTYALGRGLEYYDQAAVRSIAREAARDDYRISSFITAVVKSVPFQMRKAPEP